MKTDVRNGFASALICIGIAGEAIGQGSLTPPSGTPSPSMRTLEQVEPRKPISAVPYTITQPGSYYLTTNLIAAAGGNGITIQSSGVTLDLMGFSIIGYTWLGGIGIVFDGETNTVLSNVTVRNGSVRNYGIGIRCEFVQNSLIEGMNISSNSYHGVDLYGSYGSCLMNKITDCFIFGNGAYGVSLAGYFGQCDGNLIKNCVIGGNGIRPTGTGFGGIGLYGVSGASVGNSIVDCLLCNNVGQTINLYYAKKTRIENNHLTGSGSNGILTVGGSDNLVVRNTCAGFGTNYNIYVNDTYGPIVTDRGALSTTNGAAALSPWANFSR